MSKTVVHLDDDKFLLNMYDIKLRRAGCEVYAFQTFYSKIVEDIAKCKPDIIVSDIVHDPKDPDGVELCRRIQKNERLKNVPFVFLSNTLGYLKKVDISDLKIAKQIEKATTRPDDAVKQILEINI